jgi:hypothetical protein
METRSWEVRVCRGHETRIPLKELRSLVALVLQNVSRRLNDQKTTSQRLRFSQDGVVPRGIRDLNPEGSSYGKLVTKCALDAVAEEYDFTDLEQLAEDTERSRKANMFYVMVLEAWREVTGILPAPRAASTEATNLRECLLHGLRQSLGPRLQRYERVFGKSKECFIALIDLLGFSDATRRTNLLTASGMIRVFQQVAMDVIDNVNKIRKTHGLVRGARSGMFVFSDLLLVHTERDGQDDCFDILQIARETMEISVANGLLPRGAIACGEMVVGTHVLVGRPLLEAHALESQQDWCGIALCDSMTEWDAHHGRTGDNKSSILEAATEMDDPWLVRWTVPTKCRPHLSRLVVNWVPMEPDFSWLPDPPNKEQPPGPRDQKLRNTAKFIDYVRSIRRGVSNGRLTRP